VVQTEQVLANVRAALAAGGAGPEHIIKWNIYWSRGNRCRPALPRSRTLGPRCPTRAGHHGGVFVSALAHPDFLVEMDAVAVVPQEAVSRSSENTSLPGKIQVPQNGR
jgi:enamine deaminase RidA (YjgF/YER057c/UK114 family)